MDVPLETPGELSSVGGVERATFQPAGVTATAALSSRVAWCPQPPDLASSLALVPPQEPWEGASILPG